MFRLKRINSKGWTLVELMMTIFIMGLITPAITIMFRLGYQGLSTVEMHLQLKAMNENIALHLHEQLNANKHMFQNNGGSGGLSFISILSMANAPASVSFTQMAQAQTTTSTFSPSHGANSALFGNCLFYAAADRPQTISGKTYYGPITVAGVLDSHSNSMTINLDVYRFYYDYLSSVGDLRPMRDHATAYWLVEWQSIQYVDAFELQDIGNSDATLESNVIKWLSNSANFTGSGQPLTQAWDPTQIVPYISAGVTNASVTITGPVTAFFTLSSSGSMTPVTSPTIAMQNYTALTTANTGIVSPFNYGISGNNPVIPRDASVTNQLPPVVPQFCPATTNNAGFPGGFEVGMIGSSGGMQVLTRTFLIAEGNSRSTIWDNETSVNNSRDVW